MKLNVEIDSGSGFCYGVIRAVKTAEEQLQKGPLFSLGAIVHNDYELKKLRSNGLEIVDSAQMEKMNNCRVLIRAHGEPPSTYKIAASRGITLIDCTCPVVLRLQALIRQTHNNKPLSQIVIYGKKGHAEVNGLVGQINGNAITVDISSEKKFTGIDKIDFSKEVDIFSQTTKDPDNYNAICSIITSKQKVYNLKPTVHNTICKRVAQRHENLRHFAIEHSVIILVSGQESSNGKVLYELCKSVNNRSHFIQDSSQLKTAWFSDGDNIGICGATSTPIEQLNAISDYLKRLEAVSIF